MSHPAYVIVAGGRTCGAEVTGKVRVLGRLLAEGRNFLLVRAADILDDPHEPAQVQRQQHADQTPGDGQEDLAHLQPHPEDLDFALGKRLLRGPLLGKLGSRVVQRGFVGSFG